MEVKNETTNVEKVKEFMKGNGGVIIVSVLSVAMACKIGYDAGHRRGVVHGTDYILNTIASSDGLRMTKSNGKTYLFKATKIIEEQMDKN